MANGIDDRNDPRQQIRQALLAVLMDKIRGDRFPSPSMMNMVEQGMDEEQLLDYAEILLDKLQGDRYPSPDMIKRLANLA